MFVNTDYKLKLNEMLTYLFFVLAITEVGNLTSSTFLDCGMTIIENRSKPVLKIFNQYGETVEEEDLNRKDSGKKFLVLRNKKTNKVKLLIKKILYYLNLKYLISIKSIICIRTININYDKYLEKPCCITFRFQFMVPV